LPGGRLAAYNAPIPPVLVLESLREVLQGLLQKASPEDKGK
jgi:hypothetical protein